MKKFLLCVLLFAVTCFPGCFGSDRPPGFPRLYPVSLKITQEGQPVEGVNVRLRSVDDSLAWPLGGVTGPDGIAPLWTHGKFRGAPVGKYKVVLDKTVNEGEKEYLEAMEREDMAAARKIQVTSYSCFGEEYGKDSTTPLEIDIAKNSRVIDVDGGSAVKIKREYLK